MSNNYDDNSIRRKKGEDRVRDRPEALLGSNTLDGAKQTVLELVGNISDEKLAGFGDKMDMKLYPDGSVSLRDYGRGVPLGWNELEQEWNYFLVYEELYAGGKYEDNQEILHDIDARNAWGSFRLEDYPYMITIGLNGLGAAASQYTSEFFEVISYKRGKASRMLYKKGRHILDELEVTDTDEPDGTFIHWKPDIEVFMDVDIPAKWLNNLCKDLSYTAKLNTTFDNKGKLYEYKATSAEEIMKENVGAFAKAEKFTHSEDKRGDICVCKAEVYIGPNGMGVKFLQNLVEVRGGVHSSALNTALYLFFAEISSEVGYKLRESDYGGMFSVIAQTLTNKMSVRGQTKDYLDDSYIEDCLQSCIYDLLKTEYQKGTDWLLEIIESAKINAQNRIAVAELSKNLREVEKSTKKYKPSRKFVSCEEYDEGNAEKVEYFIIEGDSAGMRVKTARNSSYQCYLAIRGKSLNVYKAPIDKLLANNEIKDMIASLGCGVDLGIEGYESFDINKLKVGNVYFLADADIDGRHIDMLLFLIFYRLFPELLYEGRVYLVYTPLYVINTKSNEAIYCMDEEELTQKKEEVGEYNIAKVDRFKGLGETDAEALWETTLDPERRRVKQLKIDRNDVSLYDTLEVLFGKSTERRKRAILGSMMDDFDAVIDNMKSLSEYIEGLGLNTDLDVVDVEV